ncbi:carboxylating nicotinate-nucleotide diphosphorylase [Candidatus Aminicenantes bacterium AC-708-M15]|jgi:nicotinate-nucleotide pyrophosphorylase (carboxylating)|nr:carboxylating nicotinate-nucleotide diphosphorylase [SCandidatus Aminicenantes bacterium Aminicenantia_JdfR_composite]MCP2596822.1 carboxylating nicotinate-nucleotide diphosphorylase [Candidatus Aminicenantes bacterium AC-335-G13]MCP2604022.1 carboxylating nicotinate-nucleotide diphosphorylase [Candidatus Aminicenantes bacterium AC-708-M15]MCP2620927.1 carboxylating nicotinate-nucleotide diphosphorylase [Candidatus Aminicenantes bacterium AC-334-E05]
MITKMTEKELENLIARALEEDVPQGDITSESIIPEDSVSKAQILAKEEGVLAGLDVALMVFQHIDPSIYFDKKFKDGDKFKEGDVLAILEGKTISILKGERIALNFLQRLSGIATLTNKFVEAVKGYNVKILDTRKTTPCLRKLEKYAVRKGGGENHRMSLSDMVLIKDNHLVVVGSIREAVERAREKVGDRLKIEVEVKNIEELKEAIEAGADIVMLDNMDISEIKKAVKIAKDEVFLEVSGKVTLDNVKKIAKTGIDFISIGMLTHSYKSIDISLEILKEE